MYLYTVYIEHIIWLRLAPIFFSFHYYISTPEICVSEKFYAKHVSCHIQVEAPIIIFFFRISMRKRGRAKENVNFQEFSPIKTHWCAYEHEDEMRFIYIYLRSCCVWCFILTWRYGFRIFHITVRLRYITQNFILNEHWASSYFFVVVSKSIVRESTSSDWFGKYLNYAKCWLMLLYCTK